MDPLRSRPSSPSSSWLLMLLRAVLALVFGVLAFAMPAVTLQALVLVLSAFLIADGIVTAIAAIAAARARQPWGAYAFHSVLDLVAGVLAFLWPGVTVLALVVLAAAWVILAGGAMLYAAARAPGAGDGRRPWLAIGGIVSVVFGLLLVFWPIPGALVMTLWLGAYALVFGGAMLVLAFRTRRQQKREQRA